MEYERDIIQRHAKMMIYFHRRGHDFEHHGRY